VQGRFHFILAETTKNHHKLQQERLLQVVLPVISVSIVSVYHVVIAQREGHVHDNQNNEKRDHFVERLDYQGQDKLEHIEDPKLVHQA
jgi:hypothetical protein